MNSIKKCNIFQRIIYSFVPSKYGTLAYQSSGSTFLFMVLISLLITISAVGNFFHSFKGTLQDTFHVDSVGGIIEAHVPDFTIDNGELDMVEPLNYSAGKVCFYFDSSIDEISMSDVDYLVKNSGFEAFFIGSKTNAFIYNGESGEMQMIKYSQMINQKVTKQDLINLVDEWTSAKKLAPFMLGFIGIFQIISYAFLAFFACIVSKIFNLFLHKQASFGKVYAMSIYALVPYFFVQQVLAWLPFSIPSEITRPVYILLTVILGCFGLFGIHECALLENEERYKYTFEQNPYRVSGIVPGNTGVISDEDFGGYATANTPRPSYQATNGNTKVRLKGIEVEYSDMELVNKYIKGNLKDLAIQQLGEVTGLNIQDCREIVDEWDRYFY